MKAAGGRQVFPSWGLWESMEAPGAGVFLHVYGHEEEGNAGGHVARNQAVLQAVRRDECPYSRI